MSANITDPEQIHALLDRHVLANVQQPAQYVGGEINSIRKDPADIEVSIALCFPDLYTVGIPHLGYQILYSVLNALPWAAAERAYAPWPDMQEQMKARGIPLYALESFRPLRAFDAVGFTLQSELLLTNVLMMLELAGIPPESAERTGGDPLVIAGGPGASAPEPMADFVDLFFVGDGEEAVVEFARLLREAKAGGAAREEIIAEAARTIPGVYAPALYETEYAEDGLLKGVRPVRGEAPERVHAARIDDLDAAHFPLKPIVPFVEAVHDRITLEIMRGCTRGCRFCHAGMTARPARYRSADTLCEQAVASYQSTGHDEIALASLSSSDHPELQTILERLTERFGPLGVNLSLPSLRVSEQLALLVGPLSQVRKSGLTIAPEAATQRLRNVINKDVSDADLLEGVRAAVQEGWRLVKLYFMIGLPTETLEDVLAIPAFCDSLLASVRGGRGRPLRLNVTVSPFVPKPHTPFQWEPMDALDSLIEKQRLIIENKRSKQIRYKLHDPRRAVIEAVLARGDRRAGAVLRSARRLGAQFDAWDEHFSFDLWERALAENGIAIGEGASANSPWRERGADEVLPWDHIDCGVRREFLREEWERAQRGELTPDCRGGPCRACGACPRGDEVAAP